MTIRRLDTPPNRPSFAVYDLEWYPRTLQLRMVGFHDGMRYRDFPAEGERAGAHGIDDFLDHVLTREYVGWWFFAHFGGAADFCFLIESLRQRGMQVEARFSGSAAVFVEVSKSKHEKWIFVDSFFLIRASLRSIGETMGLLKGGSEEDDSIYFAPYMELRTYNERDCAILYKAINDFAATLYQLGGELRPTAASCALALFRRRYLRSNIRTCRPFNVRLRQAYIASRVEPFREFGDDLIQYDINSSFPYSMTFDHPGDFLCENDTIPPGDENMFFVDCEIEIPEMHVPPLPYRLDGKIFFPHGKFERRWMSGVDFRMAEQYGKILKVHSVMHYDKRHDLEAYVRDIYDKRKNAQGFEKDVFKILMNGLYGKFAEATLKSSIVLNPRSRAVLGEKNPDGTQKAFEVFPGCIRIEEDKNIAHEHVAIAVHVTALSRRWITEYLIADKDPYYADTDCIVTNNRNLPVSNELGGLKIEAEAEHGEFYAPKFYYLTGFRDVKTGKEQTKVKAKGFSKLSLAGFQYLVSGDLPADYEPGPKEAKPCTREVRTRDGSRYAPHVAVERMLRPKQILNDYASKYLRWKNAEGPEPMGAHPSSMYIPKTVYFETSKRRKLGDGTGRTVPWSVQELRAQFPDAAV